MKFQIDIENKKIIVEANSIDLNELLNAMDKALHPTFRQECTLEIRPVQDNNPGTVPIGPIYQNPYILYDPYNPHSITVEYFFDDVTPSKVFMDTILSKTYSPQ